MDSALDIAVHRHEQVVVVHPRGLLTVRTAVELREVLAKELTEHGRVVVDLDGLRLGRESCVAVFPAVLTQCGGWPSAKLALCRPDDAMTHALTVRRATALVPVYHLRLEAEAAIDSRPPVVRVRVQLPCDVGAAASARRLVRDMCPKWEVDDGAKDTAEFVAGELVSNAVEHACTGVWLTLERGPRGLRVSVRDGSPVGFPGPVQRSTDPLGQVRGRGLELVESLTTAWGVDAQPDGNTVWAEISR
ncbi:MAG TPA: ATP-binding protein [Pseudonocardiaceae bacterium]|jgi:anti-anti-sigma regulatory factor/anti-sigma regulatory factor (Ser/Thr protein kinase)|nr:ATP-binding protein [Pseudonocardiaceae bacterium]